MMEPMDRRPPPTARSVLLRFALGSAVAIAVAVVGGYFALRAVDAGLVGEYPITERKIALRIGLDCEVNSLLGHSSHGQNAVFEFFEFLMKTNSCHPNLPVM